MAYQWAVDAVTGEFLYGASEPYDPTSGLSAGQVRVVLSRPPDPRTERYSGNPLAPFRAVTPAETTAVEAAKLDVVASRDLDDTKAIKATMICSLWGRLNRQPTGPEITAERARWLAIYKNL